MIFHVTDHALGRLSPFLTFGAAAFAWARLRATFPEALAAVLMPNHLHRIIEYARALALRRRLGALLSGGHDSSIVVALMSRLRPNPVRTFTVGFTDDPSFDERAYAAVAARAFGTQHTEFVVRADATSLLKRLLWHHDQPYGDSSAVPTYMVSKLARQHVTVVLNGDGGDEVRGARPGRSFSAARSRRRPPTRRAVGEADARTAPPRGVGSRVASESSGRRRDRAAGSRGVTPTRDPGERRAL